MVSLKNIIAVCACALAVEAAVPTGWFFAGSKPQEYDCSVDPATKYNGQLSTYIKSKPGIVTTGFGSMMQDFSAAQYVGKRIRLSGALKSQDVTSWGGLWMRVDDANHLKNGYPSMLAFDNMQDRAVTGTTDWRNYSVVLDVAEGATGIYIGFLLDGPGTLWVSGLKVDVVGLDVPVTGHYVNAGMPETAANISFDQTQTSGIPAGWFLAGNKPGEYDCSLDPATSYNSSRSAYLRSKAGIKTTGFGTLMQQFSAAGYLGKRIRYSAFVKADSVESWAGLWMRVDNNATSVSFDNMQNRAIKGTLGWQNYSVVLDVPQDATGIFLGILLDGPGAVWLSGGKFEIVGTNVATTNVKQSRTAPSLGARAVLTGTWKTEVATPSGSGVVTYTLRQDGAKLTGTIHFPNGREMELHNGQVDGDNVTFATDNSDGTYVSVGLIKGDTISLTVTPGNDSITLKRTK